jgi:hypothetical protein
MPGLVPGIHVLELRRHCEERKRRSNPASFFPLQAGLLRFARNDGEDLSDSLNLIKQWNHGPSRAERRNTQTAKFFFIIFVDAMFTTLFERLFTKGFDAETQNHCAFLRVSRAPRRLTRRQPKFDTNKKDRIARM